MIKELLQQIHKSGLTEAQIAMRCETSQPTIHRIRVGTTKDPKSSIADKVRSLHTELVDAGAIEMTGVE